MHPGHVPERICNFKIEQRDDCTDKISSKPNTYSFTMITLTNAQENEYLNILEEFGKKQLRTHLEGVCEWSPQEAKLIIQQLQDVQEQV